MSAVEASAALFDIPLGTSDTPSNERENHREAAEARAGSSEASASQSGPNGWTDEQEQLLVSWCKDLLAVRAFHHSRGRRMGWLERAIWIPNLVIMSTAMILQSRADSSEAWRNVLMGMNAASSALLAIEKFLGLKGHKEQHQRMCAECWRIYSEISFQLSIPPNRRSDSAMFVEKVRIPYNQIVSDVSNRVSLGFQVILFHPKRRPSLPPPPKPRTISHVLGRVFRPASCGALNLNA
jgi:hypothetical protein